ncbi:MAG TPA: Gfo/Idh/MocA family oxidoreductase, partial [Pirellulales bacterium]
MINLTPEEKALGKGNFQAAIGSDLTRREFLMGTIAAGVVSGAGLGGMYFNYKKVENPVRIAFIGTGDEGGVLLGALTPDYVQVAAIADIRPFNQFRAFHGDCSSENAMKVRTGLIKKYDWKTEDNARKNVAVYEDYHDLLADKDKLGIEAVVIALPLHLHAAAAIAAMNKGLHVLTEKLMGYSVAACKAMGRVAKEKDLLLATGHQRHYSILYDNAVDCIRQGLLGDVHCIRAQWHRKADTWSPPVPTDPSLTKAELLESNLKKQEAASANGLADLRKEYDAIKSAMSDSDGKLADQWAHLKRTLANADPKDVDLLQKRITQVEMQIKDAAVDADKFGYHDFKLKGSGDEVKAREELIRWRLWERTGGGLMAELGSHQLDASGIFVGAIPGNPPHEKVLPLTVSAMGYQYLKRRECEDHVFCMYEFPKPGYYKADDKTKVADPNKKL